MLLLYLGKQETLNLRLFKKPARFFTPKTQNIVLKYHLVRTEPPFTVRTIDWMHQTGPRKGA